jgi:hypothetical protein
LVAFVVSDEELLQQLGGLGARVVGMWQVLAQIPREDVAGLAHVRPSATERGSDANGYPLAGIGAQMYDLKRGAMEYQIRNGYFTPRFLVDRVVMVDVFARMCAEAAGGQPRNGHEGNLHAWIRVKYELGDVSAAPEPDRARVRELARQRDALADSARAEWSAFSEALGGLERELVNAAADRPAAPEPALGAPSWH